MNLRHYKNVAIWFLTCTVLPITTRVIANAARMFALTPQDDAATKAVVKFISFDDDVIADFITKANATSLIVTPTNAIDPGMTDTIKCTALFGETATLRYAPSIKSSFLEIAKKLIMDACSTQTGLEQKSLLSVFVSLLSTVLVEGALYTHYEKKQVNKKNDHLLLRAAILRGIAEAGIPILVVSMNPKEWNYGEIAAISTLFPLAVAIVTYACTDIYPKLPSCPFTLWKTKSSQSGTELLKIGNADSSQALLDGDTTAAQL